MIKLKVINNELKNIIKLLCKIIREGRLIRFYYESGTSGRKEWRTIRPYMVLPVGLNIQLVGTPIEELGKSKPQAGHYLLIRLNMTKFEILPGTFDDPGVDRKIVAGTQSRVICRFIYDDENAEEVMATWIKFDEL
jgi:hypothetical protein